MKIYGTCKECIKEQGSWSLVNTRVELAMEKGDEINFKCKSCGTENCVSVDETYAKQSKIALFSALAILLLSAPISIYIATMQASVGASTFIISIGTGLIPFTCYGLILKNDRTRVNSYNHSKLKGHISMIGRSK